MKKKQDKQGACYCKPYGAGFPHFHHEPEEPAQDIPDETTYHKSHSVKTGKKQDKPTDSTLREDLKIEIYDIIELNSRQDAVRQLLELFTKELKEHDEGIKKALLNNVVVGVEGNDSKDYKVGMKNGFNLAISKAIEIVSKEKEI